MEAQPLIIERQVDGPVFSLRERYGLFRGVESFRNSIMIERLRITNVSNEIVRIESCSFIFSGSGRDYQTTTLPSEWLEKEAKTAEGILSNPDVKRFYSQLPFYRGAFSSRTELNPKESLPLFNQYFDFYTPVTADLLTVRCHLADGREASSPIPIKQYQQKNRYRFPMKGDDLITFGNPYQIWSHRTSTHGEFGFDVQVLGKNGQVYSRDPRNPKHHYCFGRPVLAPADGVVTEAWDGLPDHPIAYDRAAIEKFVETHKNQYSPQQLNSGNLIIINHGNDEFSVFGHLKNGSVKVHKGDRVRVGDMIARCGHSGSGSTSPHLHFEFINSADITSAVGLPIKFEGIDNRVFSERVQHLIGTPNEISRIMQGAEVILLRAE